MGAPSGPRANTKSVMGASFTGLGQVGLVGWLSCVGWLELTALTSVAGEGGLSTTLVDKLLVNPMGDWPNEGRAN